VSGKKNEKPAKPARRQFRNRKPNKRNIELLRQYAEQEEKLRKNTEK
jgi:hypothetical protein